MTDKFSKTIPALWDRHLDHLLMSCIDPEVIRERGYSTVLQKAILKGEGFSQNQQRCPGILMPLHGSDGKPAGCQYRPDNPRESNDNKPIKYENVPKSPVRLDVPPRCLKHIGDPAIPLYITEGIKKADSLATKGACAIALTGVWNFKGMNAMGGVTVLADWDYVALNGRTVYLVYDSDVMTKSQVRLALDRIEEHMARKEASPRRLYLSAGPNDPKVGVDDWLAQGHTLDELVTLTKPPDHQPKEKRRLTNYRIEENRIVHVSLRQDGDEDTTPLCQFNARIAEDNMKDNGADLKRWFRIEGNDEYGKPLEPIMLEAEKFEDMKWAITHWGTRAIIASTQNAKNKLREAIMLQSQNARRRTIFTHLGWRHVAQGQPPVYLMANGAVGDPNIPVEVEDKNLVNYALPAPVADPQPALRASLEFLKAGNQSVTLPLWSAMYLAPLAEILEPAFTLFVVGHSGSLKSTITGLALSHFGEKFDEYHLPAAWRDTKGRLEKSLFLAKDVPLVIDDWAPGTDTGNARQLEEKADYIIRGQGNRQARGRMAVDLSVRESYPPRGLLITSGEQVPSGFSNTARLFSVEIEKGDIDLGALTTAQDQRHLYSQAMTQYILWLQARYDELRRDLPRSFQAWRAQARDVDSHLRLPAVVACMYGGLSTALDFYQDAGVIDGKEAKRLAHEGWQLFLDMAIAQSGTIEEQRPAHRFLQLLQSLQSAGTGRLHPKDATEPPTLSPGQRLLGWTNGAASVYLHPILAYTAVRDYSQHTEAPFMLKAAAVWKDMRMLNMLEKWEPGRFTDNEWIPSLGKTERVLKLKSSVLYGQKPGGGLL